MIDTETRSKLEKYIASLDLKIEEAKHRLVGLPEATLGLGSNMSAIYSYETAKRELYESFPELKPKGEKELPHKYNTVLDSTTRNIIGLKIEE